MSDEEQLSAASQRRSRWHVGLLANSEYHDQGKNLPGVVDDAARLESCEFYQAAQSKRRRDNLKLEETREWLQDWSEGWKDGDMIMFFFFGHGAYSEEKRTQCMESIDGWLMDLMSFNDYMQSLRGIKFCAFFACCQNQPSDPDRVCKLFPLPSSTPKIFNCDTLFHFACRPGQVMYDAPTAQWKCVTEYTSCLIEILCNGRCVSEIPLYLQEKVSEKTCMQQQPVCISSFVDCAIWDDGTPIASLSSFSARGSAGNEFNALVPDLDLQTLDTFADKRCSEAATSPSGSQSTQAAPLQAFDQAAAEANEFASGNEKRPVLQLSPPSGGETAQQLQEQCVGSLPQHVLQGGSLSKSPPPAAVRGPGYSGCSKWGRFDIACILHASCVCCFAWLRLVPLCFAPGSSARCSAGWRKTWLECYLNIMEQLYSSEHASVAKTLSKLGQACRDLGEYQKEVELLERCLRIQEQQHGSEHLEVANILVDLGTVYGRLKDYKAQQALLERSLKIQEQHYGSEHPQVAKILVNLATFYGRLEDYNAQQALLERCLMIQQRHYGWEHPEVTKTLRDLTVVCRIVQSGLRDYAKLERFLKIQEQHHGGMASFTVVTAGTPSYWLLISLANTCSICTVSRRRPTN